MGDKIEQNAFCTHIIIWQINLTIAVINDIIYGNMK
jgi:hypothetical protein